MRNGAGPGETSGHPLSSQKVHRSEGDPTGPFVCVHEGTDNSWSGDAANEPADGECFYYVVTALNAGGEETRAGSHTDGTPRNVDYGSTCP